jgi:uncharacterized protein YgbK (DUF1537 family)
MMFVAFLEECDTLTSMEKKPILIIADDLTGAGDSVVQFNRYGMSTAVETSIKNIRTRKEAVVSFDTDSRAWPLGTAHARFTQLLEVLCIDDYEIVLKKIDSTFRGWIVEETEILLEKSRTSCALIAPSLPVQNRYVIGGHLMANGLPVSRSHASYDKITPILISNIVDIISEKTNKAVYLCTIDDLDAGRLPEILNKAITEKAFVVCDAVCADDLAIIVEQSFAAKPLFVGSAGLASALARKISEFHTPTSRITSGIERVHRVMLFIGSRNPITLQQVEFLKDRGAGEVKFTPQELTVHGEDILISHKIQSLADAIRKSEIIIFRSDESKGNRTFSAMSDAPQSLITRIISRVARTIIASFPDIAICASGGDTARSIIDVCEFTDLRTHCEIAPNIPLFLTESPLRPTEKIQFVTKAGGFGNPSTLYDVFTTLLNDQETEGKQV